ncbi:MAG: EF-P beta-lysylation protein EpmB [Pseudomonadota bacterium]|nr:EF-P beta-lysylation protein EpmB [Pseudomonadota bacterium]
MISQKEVKKQREQWQTDLSESFRSLSEFLNYCKLEPQRLNISEEAAKSFRFFVTQSWANRIEKGNYKDPLLLQVLPVKAELDSKPGYSLDPLAEQSQSPEAGLIHKYEGRVLVTLAGQCAIYCRYCFRRNFPYSDNQFNKNNWQKIIKYLEQHSEVYEVILSGGDPLILPDRVLEQVCSDLEKIKHLRYLRVHSRIPIVLPNRISTNLVRIFSRTRFKTSFVVHSNCAEELDNEVTEKLDLLKVSKINLFNQSVLLKGINDNARKLAQLSHKLFEHGVQPYYLHRLDKVLGASHFSLSKFEENQIMTELLSLLPGYLVPKFVEEVPFQNFKVPVNIIIKQPSNQD